MANSAQTNWNAVQIVYGGSDSKVPMLGRERTCYFHWNQSLEKHTKQIGVVVGILAFSLPSMGWIHGDGKYWLFYLLPIYSNFFYLSMLIESAF